MGSKGEINKGDFRRDYNNITWVTYKSTEDNSDIAGTGISVAYNYYPKLDGTTNNEKSASAAASR